MSKPIPSPNHNHSASGHGDPYFEMARKTHFADYFPKKPPSDQHLDVCIEFVPGVTHPSLPGLQLEPAHGESCFATGTATIEAIETLTGRPSTVRRVLLAQPLLPQRSRPQTPRPRPAISSSLPKETGLVRKAARGQVLLATLDDACPFAHPFLCDRKGSTRVVRLWDQDSRRESDPPESAPAGFSYGREFTRTDLNEVMRANKWPGGQLDEPSCYGYLHDFFLARRASHGAHGVGLLAGSRLFDGRPAAHRPEVATDASDLAGRSDLVFVKFPTVLMDCVSPASLGRHAYDGLRYILDTGHALGYKHIVVSFAYESWIGPHDGSSWFEAAVADLYQVAQKAHVKLQIVMAAGNARKRSVQARIENPNKGFDLRIAVPPDNEVPTFIELWSPGNSTDLDVSVISPDDRQVRVQNRDHVESLTSIGEKLGTSPAASVIVHRTSLGSSTLAPILVRIGPTYVTDERQDPAHHGIWTIRVAECMTATGPLHAYIGRAVGDGDSPIRGRQAQFVGLPEQQSLKNERGTLNGHACGKLPTVVGACHDQSFPYAASPFGPMHLHASDYSGSGPRAGPAATRRRAVDVSVSADDSIMRPGMLSIGATAGAVTRFVGTSVATPAFARQVANGTNVVALPLAAASPRDPAIGIHIASVRPELAPFPGAHPTLQNGALPNSVQYAASDTAIGRTKKRR